MTHPSDRPLHTGLVTIVLPARNEELAIGRMLHALPLGTLQALGFETEVFVLDGHSRDATALIAKRWGATVLEDPIPGKGNALRNAVGLFGGEFTVMLDADGTYPADAIPRMVQSLARGEADVVMGKRRPQRGSMSPIHLLGNGALSLMATMLYRKKCPDLCTGLWAFRTDALRSMPLRSRGFGLEAEFFALATRMGFRVGYVLADYLPREGDRPKLTFGADGLRILRRLMRSRFAALDGPRLGGPGIPAPHTGPEVRA